MGTLNREDKTLFGPYRVLDLSNETGMFCGKIFGDLEADVIQIEAPRGNLARNLGPYYHDIPHPERSLFWYAYNTSKKSITLNIRAKQGKEIFKRLVESADLIIETFPPGFMDTLGLGYQELRKIKSGIILTSITPFGQTGPYKDFKSTDIIGMAMSGAMIANGDPDRAPLRPSVDQSYPQTGAQAAMLSMIAIHYRNLTGVGQHVDVSIQECLERSLGGGVEWFNLAGFLEHRQGVKMERVNFRAQIVFPAKDGYIAWRIFVADQGSKTNAVVDLMKEWGEIEQGVTDVDFRKVDANRITQEEIDRWEGCFARFFAKHTKNELHQEAVKRDIMLFPVNVAVDLLNDIQLSSREYWVSVAHPELGATITYPGAPFKMSATPWRIARRAPLIGEHNDEIYRTELGIHPEELRLLKEQGVI